MDKITSARIAIKRAKNVVAQTAGQQQAQNPMTQVQKSVNRSMGLNGEPSALEKAKAWLKSLIDKATDGNSLSQSVSQGLTQLQKK